MSDEKGSRSQGFEIENLSDFLRDRKATRREYTITAKPLFDPNGDLVWLHVLATYKLGAPGTGYQESYGYAWTTAADGITPKDVDSLSIQIEVAGELSPAQPLRLNNIHRIGTATRGEYAYIPQKVTAYAVSEGPHIEATDTSDD
jgi:hypothetical protein